jgi:hypothetical protein
LECRPEDGPFGPLKNAARLKYFLSGRVESWVCILLPAILFKPRVKIKEYLNRVIRQQMRFWFCIDHPVSLTWFFHLTAVSAPRLEDRPLQNNIPEMRRQNPWAD